ncbi:MAG: aminodeoxychorismate/anthranilate synthase component II [Pseudomonadota bacterium]|nr:aminodeoxychorismate/anthranilate synthase component II [Pseudomonadota bacterium]
MLDNVDSFTFMLVDYLRVAGANVSVARHDVLSVAEALDAGRDGIVISPGPGPPEAAGISVELAGACVAALRPLLGVCLGHQTLALACGMPVVGAAPAHGKVAEVHHDNSGLFVGLPSPMAATRYHSLVVAGPAYPLIVNAWSEDGTVMAMRHAEAPAHGVQFHPESVASEHGAALLGAFVELCMTQA